MIDRGCFFQTQEWAARQAGQPALAVSPCARNRTPTSGPVCSKAAQLPLLLPKVKDRVVQDYLAFAQIRAKL